MNNNNPMDDIPSFDDADSIGDWVIDTAAATGINAYTLWLYVRAASEEGREASKKSAIDSTELLGKVVNAIECKKRGDPVPKPELDSDPEPLKPEPDSDPEPDPDPVPDPEPGPAFDLLQPDAGDDLGIDESNEEFQTPDETDDVVRQQEYDQFKHEVQGLIQNLIEFLISYDMLSDHETEERDELVSEFEMLTRDFEEDVSEFFDHLDGLLDRAEAPNGDTSEDAAIGVTDEMSELMDRLRSSVEELQDMRSDPDDETSQAVKADLEELSKELDDAQYEADDNVSRSLARLNRLLDEVGEYPDQLSSEHQDRPEKPSGSQSPRREQPQEPRATREPPSQDRERYEGREYEDRERYEEQYEEDYQERQAMPQQAAGFTNYEQRPDDSRRTSTTETDNAGIFGLLPIDAAWLGAGVAYGGLDMFSTAIVITPPQNGTELNPIFDILGGSLTGFVLWKTFILFMLFVFFYPEEPAEPNSLEWWVPIIVAAAGIVLTLSNLLGIVQLGA